MLLSRAIHAINPNAEFTIEDDNINSITWLNDTTPISVEDIQTKIDELPTDQELLDGKEDLKLSAKTKLMNGEALTEDEANVMVGL